MKHLEHGQKLLIYGLDNRCGNGAEMVIMNNNVPYELN
jgi:hypothetical protein